MGKDWEFGGNLGYRGKDGRLGEIWEICEKYGKFGEILERNGPKSCKKAVTAATNFK